MGRIHRYGQQKEVFIFNLVANDTREGKVLTRLFEKLEEIKLAMGSDKVFDVLGEVMQQTNLSQLLMEAASNARNIDDILKEIDIVVDLDYINKVKESLGESLATRFIDYTRIKEMADKAREHRLIPEYTESFFRKAFIKAEGKLKENKDGFTNVESVPFILRQIADRDNIRKSFGELIKRYPKITFDKEVAFKNPDSEFITFGHPLFESLMIWVEENFLDTILFGSTFFDPDGNLNGHILFYEGEITDGTGFAAGKRLFAFFIDKDNVRPISPSVIWDLSESKDSSYTYVKENPSGYNSDNFINDLKSKVSNLCIQNLEEYKKELLEERNRQAAIKEKYGIHSLNTLILKLDGEIVDLQVRKEKGENVDLAIYNKEERKKGYEKSKDDLINIIARERSLTMSNPKFRGIIRVVPSINPSPAMHTDDRIELIGMEVSMKYETDNGRQPTDVSKENLGFDIRSIDKEGAARYIEVKARAANADVALTQNEWFKAKRFRDDYYLYAVLNASNDPKLYVIQNPAEKLEPEQKIEVVRYIIPFEQLKSESI
jgi:hypothetical protein